MDFDCLVRFLFEDYNIRGEWVSLRQSFKDAKQYQRFVSDEVECQFGQALAGVTLLSATIKFNGAMIMQIQGRGDITALVAQSSNDHRIRGLVRTAETVQGQNLKEMIGEGGRLVLTVESENNERYQGIVGVESPTLADVLCDYFKQSEQLNTHILLFANSESVAGLLLQELPSVENREIVDWEHIITLASTITPDEMLALDCQTLLFRLFHQEKVRVYDPEPVVFECSCSRNKIGATLVTLGREELHGILAEHDTVSVDCQFCGASYVFDPIDVEELLSNAGNSQDSNTLH